MLPRGQPYTEHDWQARLCGDWVPVPDPDGRPLHQVEIYLGTCKPRIRLTARNQAQVRSRIRKLSEHW